MYTILNTFSKFYVKIIILVVALSFFFLGFSDYYTRVSKKSANNKLKIDDCFFYWTAFVDVYTLFVENYKNNFKFSTKTDIFYTYVLNIFTNNTLEKELYKEIDLPFHFFSLNKPYFKKGIFLHKDIKNFLDNTNFVLKDEIMDSILLKKKVNSFFLNTKDDFFRYFCNKNFYEGSLFVQLPITVFTKKDSTFNKKRLYYFLNKNKVSSNTIKKFKSKFISLSFLEFSKQQELTVTTLFDYYKKNLINFRKQNYVFLHIFKHILLDKNNFLNLYDKNKGGKNFFKKIVNFREFREYKVLPFKKILINFNSNHLCLRTHYFSNFFFKTFLCKKKDIKNSFLEHDNNFLTLFKLHNLPIVETTYHTIFDNYFLNVQNNKNFENIFFKSKNSDLYICKNIDFVQTKQIQRFTTTFFLETIFYKRYINKKFKTTYNFYLFNFNMKTNVSNKYSLSKLDLFTCENLFSNFYYDNTLLSGYTCLFSKKNLNFNESFCKSRFLDLQKYSNRINFEKNTILYKKNLFLI